MTVYCVDSSSWILAGDTYPIDKPMFEPFWAWFDGLSRSGQVIAPEEVYVELMKKGQSLLVPWIKDRRDSIFYEHSNDVQEIFRRILQTHPELTRKNKPTAKSDGDSWVIALAKVRGAICVSEDRRKHGGTSFPEVCVAYGVEVISLRDLIKRESQ